MEGVEMNIQEQLQAVRYILVEVPKLFNLAQKEFHKTNDETQDILHVLELGKLNAIEMSKITRQLKEVRQRRRKLKDELEILYEIRNFAFGDINEHEINKLIGTVRKINDRHENRKYTMRVRSDLQNLMEG